MTSDNMPSTKNNDIRTIASDHEDNAWNSIIYDISVARIKARRETWLMLIDTM